MSGVEKLGRLLEVQRAHQLVIRDLWAGYSLHSPIAAVYELKRTPRGVMAGIGQLSTAVASAREVEVRIPAAAAARFLDTIAGACVVPGPYEALMMHTDDFPHIEIAIHVATGGSAAPASVALLFTESQGEYHAPWAACIGKAMFTVPGDEIGRALAMLRRPLKGAVLDRMIRAADRAGARRP